MKIKPEQVIEAYKKTGLIPKQKVTLKDGCACGLGAIYALEHGAEKKDWIGLLHVISSFNDKDKDYGIGFADGFDGLPRAYIEFSEYRTGHEDGKAAWKAVVESGLVSNV
jgi:hypothetical protein